MSKTTTQLTETTTSKTDDVFAMVDVENNQDKKMKFADFWNSKPFGEMYLYENSTATTIVGATTPALITDGGTVTTVGELNNFTHDGATGKLTYTGEEDIVVLVSFSLTMNSVSGTIGSKAILNLNGAGVTKTKVEGVLVISTWLTMAKSCLLTLSKNDYIQMKVTNESSNANVVVQDFNLNITGL